MLEHDLIPQNDEEPESWSRFLYKAAKGSCKAEEMLGMAEHAYMLALTGDSQDLKTLDCEEYRIIFRKWFSQFPRPHSWEEFIETGRRNRWFPYAADELRNVKTGDQNYRGLWSRGRIVDERTLLRDAAWRLVSGWNPDTILAWIDDDESARDDACSVVAIMLFFCLTWPEAPFTKSGNTE